MAHRVHVVASRPRKLLRDRQEELNSQLWGSELAYGFAVDGPLAKVDQRSMVADHLGALKASAWHVGQSERPHYDGRRVSDFIRDLEEAQHRLPRRVLGVSVSAYYERASGRRSARWVEDERLLGRITHGQASRRTSIPTYCGTPLAITSPNMPVCEAPRALSGTRTWTRPPRPTSMRRGWMSLP